MNFLSFIWKDLIRRRSDFWIILSGIAVSVFGLLILFSLREGITKTLFEHGSQKNELSQITVYGSGGGFLKFLGGNTDTKILNQEAVMEIQNIPEVQNVSRQIVYGNLASVEIEIGGEKLRTDSLIFGEELPAASEAELIKVVISRKLIDLYNLSLAPGAGLPQLDESAFEGKDIQILPGYSSFFPNRGKPAKILNGHIIAFSDRAEIIGITVPIEVVRQLNREEGIIQEKYSKLFVTLDSPHAVAAVSQKLENEGFRVTSLQKEFKEIGKSLQYINLLLYILSSVIIITSLLFIGSNAWSVLLRRTREIGILRAIGGTKKRLIYMFLAEAAIPGFFGAVFGLGLGLLVIQFFQKTIISKFSLSSIALEDIFSLSPFLLFILLVGAPVFAACITIIPIRRILKKHVRELI